MEEIDSIFEDVKLKANVFSKIYVFDAFSVRADAVGFDLISNITSGTMRGFVVELMGDNVASVSFELEVVPFGMLAFTVIVSVDVVFDVSSAFVSDDSTCNDATSDEVFSTGHSSTEVCPEDVVSSEIASSDIVSVDTVSASVDSEDVCENIDPSDASNEISSQFVDSAGNLGSGLGAIECRVIELRAIE